MEITIITATGIVAWVAGASRTGEIYAANAKDMVSKVLSKAGDEKISRLNILDHDRNTKTKLKTGEVKSIGIQIGSDLLNEYNVTSFKTLSMLKGHFTEKGFVHLQHCYIGINQDFLKKFSTMVGVPVYGGTGAHNGLLRVNYGKYVVCDPNGVCQIDVNRP